MMKKQDYSLQKDCIIKALRKENDRFRSGEEYKRLQRANERLRKYYERQIKDLEKKYRDLLKEYEKLTDRWFAVFEDMQKEFEKRLREYFKQCEKSEEALQKFLSRDREEMQKLREKYDRQMAELIEERRKCGELVEKNQKLLSQLGQTFKNSSIPSSKSMFREKVQNSRTPSGKKQGAQEGHEGHGRKMLDNPDVTVYIDVPDEIKNSPDWYQVKDAGNNPEMVHRQVVSMEIRTKVTDYYAPKYRNRKTKAFYVPAFPEGVTLDVNYDPGIKGLIFMMRNHLNIPVEKVRSFLYEVTEGKLDVSHGMIAGINSEFSKKTQEEQDEIFRKLVCSDVLYTDMTGARVDGKLNNIVVCSNKQQTAYFFREHKGFQGYNGTPVETTNAVLVHDGDKTLLHYGSAHQLCQAHHSRYLKGASETEINLDWHREMRSLLKEMNDARNKAPGRVLTDAQREDFVTRYDGIVDRAGQEYNNNPPSEYYTKGYNLYLDFKENKDANLLFLYNPNVDFTNNESERRIRSVVRHTSISGSFRGSGHKSADDYCSAMTVLQTCRNEFGDSEIYKKMEEIFERVLDVSVQPRDEKGRFIKKKEVEEPEKTSDLTVQG